MATANASDLPNLGTSSLPMWRYDKLPPALRQALQDAPYNLSINPVRLQNISEDGKELVAEMQRIIPPLIESAALDAYGPNHPQAKDTAQWATSKDH